MTSAIWMTIWLFLRIGAGMYVAVMAMRGAVHLGATPLEAGVATVVGTMVWAVIFILEIVKASEIKLDDLVREWRVSKYETHY